MNNLSSFHLTQDMRLINDMTVLTYPTDGSNRLRTVRINEVERHIESLRRFALLKQGRVQRIVLGQVEVVETLLALACNGSL